jgi:outer membrane protein assembly factor BamA
VQSSYSIAFTEPYLFDKPMALDTVLSGYERGRESYDEQRLKGYLGLEKRYESKWARGIGVRAEQVSVDNLDWDAPKEIYDVKGDNMLYGIRPYIDKNTTDNRFLPTKGYHFDAGYEQVTGDYNFGVLDATQRWYRTLYEDLAERRRCWRRRSTGRRSWAMRRRSEILRRRSTRCGLPVSRGEHAGQTV